VQQDTTEQLYTVSSALLLSNDQALSSALRQLNQFGYDLERLQFIAKDEADLLGQVRQVHGQFVLSRNLTYHLAIAYPASALRA
jgi:hypothetical protein